MMVAFAMPLPLHIVCRPQRLPRARSAVTRVDIMRVGRLVRVGSGNCAAFL